MALRARGNTCDEQHHKVGRSSGGAVNTPTVVGVVALAMVVLTPVASLTVTVAGRILGENPSLPRTSTVVQRYMEAIVNSDAEAALGYLDQQLPDTSLKTRRVLEMSNRLAPITDVEVGRPHKIRGKDARSMNVSYRVGEHAVQTTISVHRPVHGYVVKGGYSQEPVNQESRATHIRVKKASPR